MHSKYAVLEVADLEKCFILYSPKIDEIAYTIKTVDAELPYLLKLGCVIPFLTFPLISNITNFIEETVSIDFTEAYVCT
jgi:hypothetical protein